MRFPCTIQRRNDGQWYVRYEGTEIGRVEATAPTRAEAVEKMQDEIRYRLELCPCTGETYQYIKVDITES